MIAEFSEKSPAITEILKNWFANYKGVGKIEVKGFEGKNVAEKIVESAASEFAE